MMQICLIWFCLAMVNGFLSKINKTNGWQIHFVYAVAFFMCALYAI